MDTSNGRLYSRCDEAALSLVPAAQFVDIFGPETAIADASAALRVHAEPELSFDEARERAMDELRRINRDERRRGRR